MSENSHERFSTVIRNNDNKFDIQLGNAKKAEDRLAQKLQYSTIELKTESYLWPKTGNIFIENGKMDASPTGLGVTKADLWAHELITPNGETIAYILMPTKILKEIAPIYGRKIENSGDGKKFKGYVLPLEALIRAFRNYGEQGMMKYENFVVSKNSEV